MVSVRFAKRYVPFLIIFIVADYWNMSVACSAW